MGFVDGACESSRCQRRLAPDDRSQLSMNPRMQPRRGGSPDYFAPVLIGVVILAVLLGSIAVSYRSAQVVERNRAATRDTRYMLLALADLSNAIASAQARQVGYAATGERGLADQRDADLMRVEATATELELLARGHPQRLGDVTRLLARVRPLLRRPEALADVGSVQEIQDAIAVMAAGEEQRIAGWDVSTSDSLTRSLAAAVVPSVVSILLGLVVLLLTWRSLRRERAYAAQLATSEARLRATVDGSIDSIITIDQRGRIESANPATAAIFGYEPDELIGKNVSVLMPEPYRSEHDGYIEHYLRTGHRRAIGHNREVTGRRKDGSTLALDLTVSEAVVDGRRIFTGIARDATVRKAAARAAELERSNRELSQFAYVASHDLRSPLRGIVQLAGWISEDAGAALPPESQRHLAQLRNRARRMDGLLAGLLVYARVGAVESEVERVDANEVVRETADLLAPPPGFRIEVEGTLPVLVTHRAPLELVLRNLINNAVRHHDRPGEGRVVVRAARAGDPAFVAFEVDDDGPGIDPRYHERIFKLFQTLRPRDEVEGSGVGLAVVKKTVESMGGTITVDSASGEGTTFRFTWPVHPRA
jgi:PAS domain S-box-containing protein